MTVLLNFGLQVPQQFVDIKKRKLLKLSLFEKFSFTRINTIPLKLELFSKKQNFF